MLDIKNVTKSFPGKDAIRNITISVTPGTVLGLVGPNGAGKSTLLRTIVDIYTTDCGEIRIKGENIRDNHKLKDVIGYVADRNDYFNGDKIKDIVRYYKLAYSKFDETRFHEINKIFEIPLKQKLSKLSKGNASRVFFMLALSLRPELLVLDEPTSGLDPIVKRKFLKLLMDEVGERGTTVVISSHNLYDLESICDQVVFLNNGEIIKDNSMDNLKTSMKKLQIIFKENPPSDFENWNDFINISKIGRSYHVITKSYTEELVNRLKINGALFIEELDLSLEDMLIYTIEK